MTREGDALTPGLQASTMPPPAPAAASGGVQETEGWLWKRSRRLKSWRRRHAVLDEDGTLWFFRSAAGLDVRAKYAVAGCAVEPAPAAHAVLTAFVLSSPFGAGAGAFRVHLASETSAQALRWMDVLAHAATRAGDGTAAAAAARRGADGDDDASADDGFSHGDAEGRVGTRGSAGPSQADPAAAAGRRGAAASPPPTSASPVSSSHSPEKHAAAGPEGAAAASLAARREGGSEDGASAAEGAREGALEGGDAAAAGRSASPSMPMWELARHLVDSTLGERDGAPGDGGRSPGDGEAGGAALAGAALAGAAAQGGAAEGGDAEGGAAARGNGWAGRRWAMLGVSRSTGVGEGGDAGSAMSVAAQTGIAASTLSEHPALLRAISRAISDGDRAELAAGWELVAPTRGHAEAAACPGGDVRLWRYRGAGAAGSVRAAAGADDPTPRQESTLLSVTRLALPSLILAAAGAALPADLSHVSSTPPLLAQCGAAGRAG